MAIHSQLKTRPLGVLLTIALFPTFWISGGWGQEPERESSWPTAGVEMEIPGGIVGDENAKKHRTLGVRNCVYCHSKKDSIERTPALPIASLDDGFCLLNEVRTWGSLDKHMGAYAVLLNKRSQRIAENLKIIDPETKQSLVHRDQRCLACHTGLPMHEMDLDQRGLVSDKGIRDFELNRGVSCEGCHGPGGKSRGSRISSWHNLHFQSRTWRYLDPQVKAQKHGYYNLRSAISRTRLCVSCHVGNVQKGRLMTHEMFAAGHPPLPPFELETFSDQMPQHWRDFRYKPESTRNDWLTETQKTWRTNKQFESPLEDTRDLLVAACVTYSEYLKLTADLADETVEIPLKERIPLQPFQSRPTPRWPELAQFDCAACHQDSLRFQQKELKKTRGRPALTKASRVLVELALEQSVVDKNRKETIHNLIQSLEQISEEKPFGDPIQLITKSRELSKHLDSIAHSLENQPFSAKAGQRFLADLIELGQRGDAEYDSGRLVVWAIRIVYEELNEKSPPAEFWYPNHKLEEFNPWYPREQKPNSIRQSLAGFEDLFLLNLRKGRLGKQTISENFLLPYLEWRPEIALPPIKNYQPAKYRQRMADLKKMAIQDIP